MTLGEAGHTSPWHATGMIPVGMDGVSSPALAAWRKHRDEFVTSEPGSEAEGNALAAMLATVTLDNPPLASDVERWQHAQEAASQAPARRRSARAVYVAVACCCCLCGGACSTFPAR